MDKIKKMRIPVELEQLKRRESEHGITCTVESGDLTKLIAQIPGPKDSPYEAGTFKLSITIGEQYPFLPPVINFNTCIFHPNIDSNGKICLDLLRMPPAGSYNPAITLESILISIQLLLATPNPDDPLRGDAADLFKTNYAQFEQQAKEFVKKYCSLKQIN